MLFVHPKLIYSLWFLGNRGACFLECWGLQSFIIVPNCLVWNGLMIFIVSHLTYFTNFPADII